MRILTVNAGSSTLKLHLLDNRDQIVASDDVEHADDGIDRDRLAAAIGAMGEIDAVGHRVVHGGTDYSAPVVIDSVVRSRLADLTVLAPLHQPAALAGIDTVVELLPDIPQVACFDTAFHQTLSPAAYTYAVPVDWRERLGVRRFGFHGLSHRYAAHRAAELLSRPVTGLRIVSCHLGAGASLAAIHNGRSVDTTMGFTPLEGVVMATRSGSVDPGLLLWLQQHAGIGAEEISDQLEHHSGLAALAGTPDMREVLRRVDEGDERAGLALRVYVHRFRAGIAAMVAAVGGLDALVFTGGIGEHAPAVRSATAEGLGYLGIAIDPGRNAGVDTDADISTDDAVARSLVITAREDPPRARPGMRPPWWVAS